MSGGRPPGRSSPAAELDRLLAELFTAARALGGTGRWFPPVDVIERPDALVIRVSVPGLSAEELEIELDSTELLVRGRRTADSFGGTTHHVHGVERPAGLFERRLPIDTPTNRDEASARLRLGVLEVTLPRIPERRQTIRRLEIREDDDE